MNWLRSFRLRYTVWSVINPDITEPVPLGHTAADGSSEGYLFLVFEVPAENLTSYDVARTIFLPQPIKTNR